MITTLMVHINKEIQGSKHSICQIHTRNSVLTKVSMILHEIQPIFVLTYHPIRSSTFIFLTNIHGLLLSSILVSETRTAKCTLAMILTMCASVNTINPEVAFRGSVLCRTFLKYFKYKHTERFFHY